MTALPGCLEEVTEDWVAEALTDTIGELDTMTIENLGDGIGQVSELGKLTITSRDGGQHTLIIKTRTNVPAMHDIGLSYGMYEREVNFYQQMADDISLRTPEIYYAEWDPDGERVVLLMEFMNGWYSPDQVAGATREEVEKAIRGLAPLTASYWNSPLRGRIQWLGDSQSDYYRKISADYPSSIDGFLERFGDQMSPDIERTLNRIDRASDAILKAQAEGTYALTHWDYRVENLFFKTDEPDVAVIDWQLMMWMKPAWDFTYLCFTNITLENRHAWLEDLSELYLEELARNGVEGYGKDELRADIRLCLPGISVVPVIGGSSFDETNARSKALFGAVANRIFSGIEEMECMSRLDCVA